jgi:cytoskeleton-associated protein 5
MLVLLGTLCDKSGVNNKHLQESIRKLIRMCYELYDNKGCLRIIIDSGLKNKNLKSVAECLDEMADYIQKHGVDHLMKKDYKLLIDLADNKDKGVRETSLKVFGEAYTVLGEKIWTFLKDIPLKVKGLLE